MPQNTINTQILPRVGRPRPFKVEYVWLNTLFVALLWPAILLAFIYIFLFFVLNSSFAVNILNTTLSSLLKGEFRIERISTDPYISHLHVGNARIYESGADKPAIDVRHAKVKIPTYELFRLFTETALVLPRIAVSNAHAVVDLRGGEVNMLNIFLPAEAFEPTSSEPGSFKIILEELRVKNGSLDLHFDGFDVEMREVNVDDFTLSAGAILEMRLPQKSKAPLTVASGQITFNPTLFTFPTARWGAKDVGLIFDFASGFAELGKAHRNLSTALKITALDDFLPPFVPFLGTPAHDVRGDLVVPLSALSLNGFNWTGMEFAIEQVEAGASGASVSLKQAWVSIPELPATDDLSRNIAEAVPPNIDWSAKLSLTLPAEDKIIRYFVGPGILSGQSDFALDADMKGDLKYVEGELSLKAGNFKVMEEKVNVDRLELSARLDGQKATVHALRLETPGGNALVTGFYEIMDGNFDFNANIGSVPENVVVGDDFSLILESGFRPFDLIELPGFAPYAGLLRADIGASGKDGKYFVRLNEDLTWKFDKSIFGIENITLSSHDPYNRVIVTYENGVVTSPGGILFNAGPDSVAIFPGMYADTKHLDQFNFRVMAQIKNIAPYAEAFGIDASSDPVSLDIGADIAMPMIFGYAKINTGKIEAFGYRTDTLSADWQIVDSKLKTKNFSIYTPYGNVDARIEADFVDKERQLIADPLKIPFQADVRAERIDVATIPLPPELGAQLSGNADARLKISGPLETIKISSDLTVRDLAAFGEFVPSVKVNASFGNNIARIERLDIDFGKDFDASLTLENTAFSLKKNTLSGRLKIDPLPVGNFNFIKKNDIPLSANLDADLEFNLNLGAFAKNRSSLGRSGSLSGSINIRDLKYQNLVLGNSSVRFLNAGNQIALKGKVLDLIDLDGYLDLHKKVRTGLALNVTDFDILQLFDKLQIKVDTSALKLKDAKIGGTVSACCTLGEKPDISLSIDTFVSHLLNDALVLMRPLHIDFSADTGKVRMDTLELSFGNSRLKIAGNYALDGSYDASVNGSIEIDPVTEFVPQIKEASGTLAISVESGGKLFDSQGNFTLSRISLSGFFGVRNKLMLLSHYAPEPVTLSEGLIAFGKNEEVCPGARFCIYTPDATPFRFTAKDRNVDLNLKLDDSGDFDATLGGEIGADIAALFSSEISEARGSLLLDFRASGDLLDKHGAFRTDKLDINGLIAVKEPILVQLRTLPNPVELFTGTLRIGEGLACDEHKSCFIIPKDDAFSGKILGGNFSVFGEFEKVAFMPRKGYLAVNANNLTYRLKDEIAVTLSPDIRLDTADPLKFDTYAVKGSIDIIEASYSKNFDIESEFIKNQILSAFLNSKKRSDVYTVPILRKIPSLGKMKFALSVSTEKDAHVYVKIAGASVSLNIGTQLNIGGTLKEPTPSGFVNINDGSFYLRGNNFEFQNGSQITFKDSLDGSLDLIAQTEVSTSSDVFSSVLGNSDLDRRKRIRSSDVSSDSEIYLISLNINGSVFAPRWNFDCSPPLSDANIYSLIFTGKTIDEFSSGGGDSSPAVDIAMESIISPFFESQIDTFLKADDFKFLFSEGAAQFVYIKKITKQLKVAAGVSIRGADGNEQALSSQYFFNDYLSVDLTGQNTIDEQGQAPTFKLGSRFLWHIPISY